MFLNFLMIFFKKNFQKYLIYKAKYNRSLVNVNNIYNRTVLIFSLYELNFNYNIFIFVFIMLFIYYRSL